MVGNIRDRIVSGKVIKVGPNVAHVKLDANKFGALWARTQDPLPENLKRDQRCSVFLLDPSPRDPELFYARLDWADENVNPWIANPLRTGAIVDGRVTRYTGRSGAIVTLDDERSCYLNQSEVPGALPDKPIQAYLEVGDRLRACVQGMVNDRLQYLLSIKKYLEFTQSQTLRQRGPCDTADTATIPPLPQFPDGKSFLVLDNDANFKQALASLLEAMGASDIVAISDKNDLQAILRDDPPSHAFLDWNLDHGTAEPELQILLAELPDTTAIMTGDSQKPEDITEKRNVPLFRKPLDPAAIVAWVAHGRPPRNGEREGREQRKQARRHLQKLFSDEDATAAEETVFKKVDAFLKTLCQDVQSAVGALWCVHERDGVYSVRGFHGIAEEHIEGQEIVTELSRTIVDDAIRSNQPMRLSKDRAGYLGKISPNGTVAIYAWPFCASGEEEPRRAILVFSGQGKNDPHLLNEYLKHRLSHCQLLVDHLDLVRRNSELDAFAAIGRMQAGLYHELRGDTGTIISSLQVAVQQLRDRPDIKQARRAVGSALETAERYNRASAAKLDITRDDRGKLTEPHKVISAAVHSMKMVIDNARDEARVERAKEPDVEISYETWVNQESLIIQHPPMVLERTVLNLLNNAINLLLARGDGVIEIRCRTGMKNNVPYFFVDIQDNGPGIPASVLDRIFEPRETTTKDGFGLGLYLSRKLVEQAGGTLELLESIRWAGTCFRLSLPMTRT